MPKKDMMEPSDEVPKKSKKASKSEESDDIPKKSRTSKKASKEEKEPTGQVLKRTKKPSNAEESDEILIKSKKVSKESVEVSKKPKKDSKSEDSDEVPKKSKNASKESSNVTTNPIEEEETLTTKNSQKPLIFDENSETDSVVLLTEIIPSEKEKSFSKMSTYELLSNPSTLTGGMGLFRQRLDNKINHKEFEKRLGSGNKDGSDNQSPVTRSRSKRSAGESTNLNPCGPSNPKKEKHEIMSEHTNTSRSKFEVSETHLQLPEEFDDSENEETTVFVDERSEGQFGELLKRYKNTVGADNYEDEFDLTDRNQVMKQLFQDYELKVQYCKLHSRNVRELTSDQLDQEFEKIVRDMVDIFEGNIEEPIRLTLYLSEKANDRNRLRNMIVADPFTHMQGMEIGSKLCELLLPVAKERMRYDSLMQLVMLPEALIRIYADVNNVTFAMAEKEMKCGPRWEGPVPAEWSSTPVLESTATSPRGSGNSR